jgi:anti-anti-sigma factor
MRNAMLTIHAANDGVVRVVGEVDAATAPELLRHLEDDPSVRVLDLEHVTFFDSSGLKVLAIVNRSRDGADPLTLHAPSDCVRRVLQIAGMTEWFRISTEPADAAE